MSTRQLNRKQMDALKVMYLCEIVDNPSYGEIADAPYTISDETIHNYYDGYSFSPDDFF